MVIAYRAGIPRTRRARRTRQGSALIASLLVIVILSATAAAAFSMVGSEQRTIEDHAAVADAHAMARSAYEQFIANPTGALASFNPPTFAGPESVKYSFSDGYAWVSIQRVQPSVDESLALYLVRSRAVRTAFVGPRRPVAERVFAQYARWHTGDMPALAAWTSLTGLQKNGGAGTISGYDNCGAKPPVAGVAVPTVPGYSQSGGALVPDGSPDVLSMGTQPEANAMVPIDWAGIVSGTALTPDLKIPGASWPSFSDPNYWPIIFVDQASTFTLPAPGRGILIVRNNAVLTGSDMWDGIVLVGGTLTSDGNNTVSGAVVSGLNVLLGETVPVNDVGNGNKTFQYDSCNVAKAAERFLGLRPLRNTSVDNWSTY